MSVLLKVYGLVFHSLYFLRIETADGFLTLQCIPNRRKGLHLPCKCCCGGLHIDRLTIYIVGTFVFKSQQYGYIYAVGWRLTYITNGSRPRVNLFVGQEVGYGKKAEQHQPDGGNAIADKRGGYLSYDAADFFATKLKALLLFLLLFHISFLIPVGS